MSDPREHSQPTTFFCLSVLCMFAALRDSRGSTFHYSFKEVWTADRGNAEMMIDPVTGGPHTAHTTNPVPFT